MAVSSWRGALLLVVVIVFTASLVRGGKRIPTTAGPYITTLDRFEDCVPPGDSKVQLRLSHHNPLRPHEKQYLWGNFFWAVNTDDNSTFLLRLDKWSNNQWKENFFVFNFKDKACSVLRDVLPFVQLIFDVAKHAGASKERGHCFMPKGQFDVSNRSIDLTFPTCPVMPYGRYRGMARVASPKSEPGVVNCLTVVVQFLPKPT